MCEKTLAVASPRVFPSWRKKRPRRGIMQYVGFVLLGLAIIGGIAAFLQIAKGKKILAAPFKKTGEVASNPQAGDAKGLVSCEGDVKAASPLTSPCTNQPCVYYEYKLEREVEESTLTENGTKKTKKWQT